MGICGSQQAQQETPKEAPKPVEREPTNNEVSDSDFVFFIEMESDSDEVSLDPVEKGYPAPKPPNEPNGTNGLRLSQILVKEGFSGNTDENENEVFSQEQIDDHARKYGHKRFARRQLLKSVEGNNIEEIQSCITKCENAHFKLDDPDIVYARSKVEVLSLRKAIHEAKQRRHLGVTVQTIEQLKNSKFERIFRRDVKVLKKFAETLRALNGFTQELPRLSEALLELCNRCMPNVVVQNVLTAFLLLFGEQVEPDWEFEDIQSFSKRLYGNILQQQESRISEISARRAQTVLQNCTIEETMVNTMAATKMQTWINDVVTTVLKGYDDGSDEHDM